MAAGLLIARPRKSAHDGTRTNAGPSFDGSAQTVDFQGGIGSDKSAYVQFPTRLPAGAIVSAATLRLKAAVATVAGGTHTFRTIDYATDGLDVAVGGAATLGTVNIVGDGWTAGEWVAYDVSAAVLAALAVRNLVTVRIDCNDGHAHQFYSFDKNWLDAARLEIAFDWTDTEDNPYSLALAGLWALLESNPYFAALVPPGNRVKHSADGGRDPEKENASAADYPEVRIVAAVDAPQFSFTSSHLTDLLGFQIEMRTGDQRLDALFHPVKFAVFRALHGNFDEALRAVRWRGHQICRQTNSTQLIESLDNAQLNRGVRGWTGLWQVQIPVDLPIAEL